MKKTVYTQPKGVEDGAERIGLAALNLTDTDRVGEKDDRAGDLKQRQVVVEEVDDADARQPLMGTKKDDEVELDSPRREKNCCERLVAWLCPKKDKTM